VERDRAQTAATRRRNLEALADPQRHGHIDEPDTLTINKWTKRVLGRQVAKCSGIQGLTFSRRGHHDGHTHSPIT